MCSLQEIQSQCTKGTGCGFDAQRVWTSSNCQRCDTIPGAKISVSTPSGMRASNYSEAGWSCKNYDSNGERAHYIPTTHYSLAYLFDDDDWKKEAVVVRAIAPRSGLTGSMHMIMIMIVSTSDNNELRVHVCRECTCIGWVGLVATLLALPDLDGRHDRRNGRGGFHFQPPKEYMLVRSDSLYWPYLG